jgi:hypothetical protein
MKKIYNNYIKLFLLVLIASSCIEETPNYYEFEGYDFSNLDPNGGTWKTILVTSPTQITVPAPNATSSAQYQAELSEMKQKMSSLTPDEQAAVKYWTNNPVLRWNEIALELAAKYNLIPGPNADGTYTLPIQQIPRDLLHFRLPTPLIPAGCSLT